jgi:hypothetical protein
VNFEDSINFIKNYCIFEPKPNYVWILKGISRSKDNAPNSNFHKCMKRYIISSADQIEDCYCTWREYANDPSTVYRTYISLNARNIVKGFFELQKQLVDMNYDLSRGIIDPKVYRIDSVWKTALEQNCCRATKRFLLDVDNCLNCPEGLIDYITQEMKQEIIISKHTNSGYAIVINACDTRGLSAYAKNNGIEMDIQKDSMVFVDKF